MKIKYIITLFSFLVIFMSNAQFGLVNEISSSVSGPIDSKAVDLDNDGDLDILSASRDDNKVSWYENIGNGIFGMQQVISINTIGVNCVQAADIDNDGDLDVISASRNDNKIAWYENMGQGLFGTETLISNNVSSLSIHVNDLDNDGDIDIIVGDISNNDVIWFENLGNSTFSLQQNINNNTLTPYFVYSDDLDGDGDIDILSTSYLNDEIRWFENQGNGNFGPGQNIFNWSSKPRSISTADLDNDGDLDVITTAFQDDDVYWIENDGGTFNQYTVTGINGANHAQAGDMDGDGDLDIIYSGLYEDEVKWIKNQGGGNFTAIESISTLCNGPESIAIGDIDDDGDLDVVVSSIYDDDITWYDRAINGNFWNENNVSNNLLSPMDIDYGDVDGDSLKDIICIFASDGTVGWYKNLGSSHFSTNIQIISAPDYQSSTGAIVSASDLDNDGDLDILTAASGGNEIIWFENLGFGTFGPKQIVFEDAIEGLGVYAVDINNDGLLDIVSTSQSSTNDVIWFENLGSGSFSSEYVLSPNSGLIESVTMCDFDQDGDQDILTSHYYDNSIVWLENIGGNTFNSPQFVSNSINAPLYSIGMDIDGDLDNDIISSSWGDSTIVWFENDGTGSFGTEQVLFNTSHPVKRLFAEDIDSDGDLDLITCKSADSFISWYENVGNATFNVQNPINCGGLWVGEALPTDIDEDGDLDLIYTTASLNRIAWNENYFSSQYKLGGEIFYDLNEDGIKTSDEGPLDLFSVTLSPNSQASFTNGSGSYFFSTNPGTYTVNYVTDTLWNLTTDSISYTKTLSNTSPIFDSLNFGFHPDTLLTSINSQLTGGFPRCNSIINYWINYNNKGTTVPSGIVHLELHDSITFFSSEFAPDSIVGQNIYWHFDSLYYYEQASIQLQVITPNFMSMGDTLTSTVTIIETDTNGVISEMFLDSLSQIIVCAYDPNDKAVIPLGLGSHGFVGQNQEFEYLVRFQNTGNDTALTVVVRDLLDSDLDWTSFELLGSSHPVQVWIEQDGEAVFSFQNIMLPDSNVNEIESHGFLKYKISAKENIDPNSQITNTAHIYFDSNPPVLTNTVLNTIYDCNTLHFNSPLTSICSNDELSIAFNNDGFSNYNWMIDSLYNQSSSNLFWIPDTSGVFNISLTVNNEICTKDSTRELVINESYSYNENFTICDNDSIFIAGHFRNTSGTYYDSLQSQYGCDSLITTELSVNNSYFSDQNITICHGDSVLIYGVYQKNENTYFNNYQTIQGCDSVLATNLYLNTIPTVELAPFADDTVCLLTGEIAFPDGFPIGGEYTNDGVLLSILNTNSLGEGIQEIVYSYSDANNCINSDTTVIHIMDCAGINNNDDIRIIIYPNPSTGAYILELPVGLRKDVKIEIYDVNSKLIRKRTVSNYENQINLNLEEFNDGIYYIHIINSNKTYIRKLIKIKE